MTTSQRERLAEQIDALEQREADIEADREKILRGRGWLHSSAYPDCRWRWSKVIDGNRITEGDSRSALRIELFL